MKPLKSNVPYREIQAYFGSLWSSADKAALAGSLAQDFSAKTLTLTNDLAVTEGGTGSSNVAAARVALVVPGLADNNTFTGSGNTSFAGNVGIGITIPIGKIDVRNNPTTNPVGAVSGVKIEIGANATANPGVGDFVALYSRIESDVNRTRIWGSNFLADVPSGFDASAWGVEVNVNNAVANAPDPRTTLHKLGVDVVSGSTFAPSAAFSAYSTTLANRWKHGLWFDYVGGQTGSTLIKAASNINVDFGLDLSSATINFQGVRIGSTPATHVAPLAVRQFANNQGGIYLQRFTDTAPTGNLLQITNAANTVILLQVDAVGNLTCNGTNANANIFVATGAVGAVAAGQVAYGATTATTVGAAGAASALPANPLGYLIANVAGTNVKIPYYNN